MNLSKRKEKDYERKKVKMLGDGIMLYGSGITSSGMRGFIG